MENNKNELLDLTNEILKEIGSLPINMPPILYEKSIIRIKLKHYSNFIQNRKLYK